MRAAESCGFLSQAEARPEPLLQIWTFRPAITYGALSVRATELDEEHPGHDERNAGHHGAGQRFTEEEP